MSADDDHPAGAWEEDTCLLCEAAPHPNCEAYAVVQFVDPERVPLGESHADHLVTIPVCASHHEALKQYQRGCSVAEVEVR